MQSRTPLGNRVATPRRRSAGARPLLLLLLILLSAAIAFGVAAPDAHAKGWVVGNVTNQFSAPLPGVTVDIYRMQDWDWQYWTSVTTDGLGFYYADVPQGWYTCQYTDTSGVYGSEFFQDESYLYSADWLTVYDGTVQWADATLDPAAHVDGYVYGSGGAPLADVWVEVYRSTGSGYMYDPYLSGYTDAGGHFDLTGAGVGRGDYRFKFYDWSAAGHAPQWYNGHIDEGDADSLYCDAGGTYTLNDTHLAAGATVSGSVYTTYGYPLGGWCWAEVDAYRYDEVADRWEWVRMDFPGWTGRYRLTGLAEGDYRIGFGADGFVSEYWDDQLHFDDADALTLAAGQQVTGIDGELARVGGITGTVSDPEGEPLGGVHVQVWGVDKDESDEYWYVADASTDSSGAYYIEGLMPDDYQVHFTAWDDWYGQTLPDEWWDDMPTRRDSDPVTVVPGKLTRDVDAQLSPWGNVTGTVTDDGGAPIAGVPVVAFQYDGAGWEYVADTSTDSTGDYDLDRLWRGRYKIRFGEPFSILYPYRMEWWSDRPDRSSADSVRIHNGITVSGVDAQLTTPARISGSVYDETGAAKWPWAIVLAYRPDGDGWELAGLDYTFYHGGDYDFANLAAGSYRIQAIDFAGMLSDEWYSDKTTIAGADPVVVADGDHASGTDLYLPYKGAIAGHVDDPGGAPLGGIQIEAWRDMGGGDWEYVADTTTDSSGDYQIDSLDVGDYKVHFRDQAFTYAPQWFSDRSTRAAADPVAVTGGALTAPVDATLVGSSAIAGNVYDSTFGGPVEGVQVQVWASDGAGGWEYVWDTSGWGWTETDDDGRYRIDGLPPGIYRVGFYPVNDRYATDFYYNADDLWSATDIPVGAGTLVGDIDGWLDPAGHITGTVTDNGGRPLSDILALVYESDGAGGWRERNGAMTNARGDYDIGGLDTGNYLVEFRDPSDIFAGTWYQQQPDMASAVPVSVWTGGDTYGIDAVLDHPSDITSLWSPTHPSEDIWYSNSDPAFGWDPRDWAETAGYSWTLDDQASTTPPKTPMGPVPSAAFTGVPDGEWWFHVRGSNLDNSYGPASHYRVRIDTTPPLTSDDVAAGWHRSPFTFNLIPVDAHSGVDHCEVSLEPAVFWIPGGTVWTLSGSGWEGTVPLYYRSADRAGNVEEARQVDIDLDGAPPTTTVAGNDTAWHKDPVTLTFTPSDGGSGVDRTEWSTDAGATWATGTTATISANGSNTVWYRSTDKVGNVETAKTVDVFIDTLAPTTGDDADGAWHGSPVTVTLTPTDAQSGMVGGLAKTEYRLDGGAWTTGTSVAVPAPTDHSNDGSHAILYRSTDAVGNLESTGSCTVRIDTRAPDTVDDSDGAWHNTDTTVHFTASDAGSGVAGTEYSTDGGGTWTPGTSVVVTAPVDHANDGVHEIRYRSTDNLGHVEAPRSCEVKIDTTTPVTTDDSDGLWHNADVTVHFTATDPLQALPVAPRGAGVDYTEWSTDGGTNWTTGTSMTVVADPVAHATDGTTTVSYRSVNNLGAVEPTKTCDVNIDTQGPATKARARASVVKGRKVRFKYRVNDLPVPGSPTATVVIKVKKGTRVVKTLKPGVKNVNADLSYRWRCKLKRGKYRWWIYATDAAGNPQVTIGKGYLTVK